MTDKEQIEYCELMINTNIDPPFECDIYDTDDELVHDSLNYLYSKCIGLQNKLKTGKKWRGDEHNLHKADCRVTNCEKIAKMTAGASIGKVANTKLMAARRSKEALKGRVEKKRTDPITRGMMKLSGEERAMANIIIDCVKKMPGFKIEDAKKLTVEMETDESDTDVGSAMSDEPPRLEDLPEPEEIVAGRRAVRRINDAQENFREAAQKPRPQPPRHLPTTTATRTRPSV